MSSLSHARRAAPSCQCLLWCVPSALGAALPAELPRAQDMAQLLRRLRWLATDAGLQGGALFDGEQLLLLLQGERAAVDETIGLLAARPPALDLDILYRADGQADAGAPLDGALATPPASVGRQHWRLAYVEPGGLLAETLRDAGDQSRVAVFLGMLADAAGE